MLFSMIHLTLVGLIIKIGASIIGLISVFVVHGVPFRARTDKGGSDQLMYSYILTKSVCMQCYGVVFTTQALLQYAARLCAVSIAITGRVTAYPTNIGNGIKTLVSYDWKPCFLFTLRKVLCYTRSIHAVRSSLTYEWYRNGADRVYSLIRSNLPIIPHSYPALQVGLPAEIGEI